MSKSNSRHFSGTGGAQLSRYALGTHSKVTKPSESDIIASKVKWLDLREHPSKYKQLYGWHSGNFKKSLPGKPISTKSVTTKMTIFNITAYQITNPPEHVNHQSNLLCH